MKRVIQLIVLLSILVITASADGPGGTPIGDGNGAGTMSGSSGPR